MDLVNTGIKQFVGPDHQAMSDRLGKEEEYSKKAGEHLWVTIVTYKVGKESLRSMSKTPLNLDVENLLSVEGPGCYICGEIYSRNLLDRACPGEMLND